MTLKQPQAFFFVFSRIVSCKAKNPMRKSQPMLFFLVEGQGVFYKLDKCSY